ncbi:MAG: zinc-ribbon domain-containing protein [Erysipelotrichaceae bacterium]|nr:zinc-ribbon domain-containing protein [Erysipelotrichaceae bacterium]
MIIFGWRTKNDIMGDGSVNECSHCHNTAVFHILRKTSWFTLFFIPIIPYHREYYYTCPVCEYGRKIDKVEAEGLLDGVRIV